MAGRRGGVRRSGERRLARTGLAALLLAVAAGAGCAAPDERDSDAKGVQRMLDRRATALVERARDAFLAPVAPGLRARERRKFENLAEVPLRSWAYRITGLERIADRAVVQVQLRYRLRGYDSAPVTAERRLALTERDGEWRVDADDPGKDSVTQLWEQGRVEAVRGKHSLVLGVGQDERRLRGIADDADRAVPAVDAAWRGKWAGRVVVLVPASLDGMAALLGSAAAGYRGIAAVTTGEVGAPSAAPADRVIVNPAAYGVLGSLGRRVVLTHETAHVATRSHTSAATPLWLSEGYADWAGYLGTGRTPRQAAPELARAVRAGQVPEQLPADKEFRFGGDSGAADDAAGERLGRAYESGWLACRMIADRWGQEKLEDFYRAVGDHRGREGAVAGALREVLDTGTADFTARWRAYVREQLG